VAFTSSGEEEEGKRCVNPIVWIGAERGAPEGRDFLNAGTRPRGPVERWRLTRGGTPGNSPCSRCENVWQAAALLMIVEQNPPDDDGVMLQNCGAGVLTVRGRAFATAEQIAPPPSRWGRGSRCGTTPLPGLMQASVCTLPEQGEGRCPFIVVTVTIARGSSRLG